MVPSRGTPADTGRPVGHGQRPGRSLGSGHAAGHTARGEDDRDSRPAGHERHADAQGRHDHADAEGVRHAEGRYPDCPNAEDYPNRPKGGGYRGGHAERGPEHDRTPCHQASELGLHADANQRHADSHADANQRHVRGHANAERRHVRGHANANPDRVNSNAGAADGGRDQAGADRE